jgi:hypothetical protein
MFRQFSRTLMTNANPNLLKTSNKSRALEFGAQVASIGAQITLFVYLNHKPETGAEPPLPDDQANRSTNFRY